ncbi:MAG: hypothetical protein IJX39_00665 [Clostridia bacterium]|nr:hypothetical protein [Clostridia bacterium]
MKKIRLLLLLLCGVLLLAGCGEEQIPTGYVADERVTVTVTTAPITAETEEIDFTVTNGRFKKLVMSEDCYLVQRKSENGWENLTTDATKRIFACEIKRNKTAYVTLPVGEWYGSLESGEYRLIVSFFHNYDEAPVYGIAAFTVDPMV